MVKKRIVRRGDVKPKGGEATISKIRKAVKEVYHTPPPLPPVTMETTYVRRRYLTEQPSIWLYLGPALALGVLLTWAALAGYYFNQPVEPPIHKVEAPKSTTRSTHQQPEPRLGQFP